MPLYVMRKMAKLLLFRDDPNTVLDSDLVEQNSPKKESIENNNTKSVHPCQQ